jgi:hypothetical protein
MAELVIIGNGFDKAHGLETDYKDFMKSIFNASSSASNSTIYQDLFY